MDETWKSLFIKQAKELRHSDKFIKVCLDYARNLHAHNLPVIFDLAHLAQYLTISPEKLKYTIDNSVRLYKSFELKKANNKGTRKINAPFPSLKVIQQWININILCRDKNILPCCHAFMPQEMLGKRNILSNASPHAGCLWLLNMDLKNFFPTISYAQVYLYFYQLGYINEVATALAQLCCRDYRLPQGAPSSPMIANHVALEMDQEILAYCQSKGLSYTRYADDITISGKEEINAKQLIKDIESIVFACKFVVNRKKTKFRRKGQRQMVTGLTVDNGIHVRKAYRKEIFKELYCCQKFGASNHIKFRNEQRRNKLKSEGIDEKNIIDQGFYRQWLLGRIMYVRSIEPNTGKKMLEKYNNISWML